MPETDGPAIELRPVSPADRDLLFRIYAGTRTEEMALLDWPEPAIEAFLRQQFEAQDTHYRGNYPGASFDVIVVGGQPAGRLYLHLGADETRIIDIALLADFRGLGVGTRLLGQVMDSAGARGASVTIHVERNNPALRWYRRLGFQLAEDKGVYLFLRWSPAPAP